jgi:hypothetical protein
MTRRDRVRLKGGSVRGRRMALRRWELDRAKRERLAAMDPLDSKPVRRIIDVVGDSATEICIFAHDSAREVRRKLRARGLTLAMPHNGKSLKSS